MPVGDVAQALEHFGIGTESLEGGAVGAWACAAGIDDSPERTTKRTKARRFIPQQSPKAVCRAEAGKG